MSCPLKEFPLSAAGQGSPFHGTIEAAQLAPIFIKKECFLWKLSSTMSPFL